MGCYLTVTNKLFLGYTGELSIEKASRRAAKASSKLLRTGNSLVPNNILPYSLMFHIAKDVYTFILLGNFQ